jgi:hypothetical protein
MTFLPIDVYGRIRHELTQGGETTLLKESQTYINYATAYVQSLSKVPRLVFSDASVTVKIQGWRAKRSR